MAWSTKWIVFLLAGLLLLFVATDPVTLPSAVLIVPFVIVFMIIALAIIFLSKHTNVTIGRSLRAGALGAAMPTLLLVLQSLGQLTLRDALTILALFGITYFYVARMTSRTGEQ